MKGPVENPAGKKKIRRPMESIVFDRVYRAVEVDGVSYQTKRRVLLSVLDLIAEMSDYGAPSQAMPSPAEAMPDASPWYLPKPGKDSR